MYWRGKGDDENLVVREQAAHDLPGLEDNKLILRLTS